mgnify:CR=1 FL=1
MNRNVYHGLIAGLGSALAGIGYSIVYQNLLFLDFNSVLSYTSIFIGSTLSCFIMAIAYWALDKLNRVKFRGIVNVAIVLFSFSIKLTTKLPLLVFDFGGTFM